MTIPQVFIFAVILLGAFLVFAILMRRKRKNGVPADGENAMDQFFRHLDNL